RYAGVGGTSMRDQGLNAVVDSEELSIMGFTEVIGHLPRIVSILRRIKREFRKNRPDLVVLIDAPEFNFRIAKMAARMSIPVVYYISPKVWAWRQGRVKFIRNYVKKMISILPFEREFYSRFQMPIEYVGHPLVDFTRKDELLAIHPEQNRVGILPGSRLSELKTLLPLFGEVSRILRILRPELQFHLVRAPGVEKILVRSLWPEDVPLTIRPHEDRYEVIRSCTAVMAASGTVTLETGLLEVPTAVAYRFSPLTAAIARRLIKVPYASLTNLVLGKEVFPELLQEKATPRKIAGSVMGWISSPESREQTVQELKRLPELLGPPGAVHRAADIILAEAF
ncbi:MAG: lipid-A-disaccharide synthase, partial [Desulfovibrionales bacterium]